MHSAQSTAIANIHRRTEEQQLASRLECCMSEMCACTYYSTITRVMKILVLLFFWLSANAIERVSKRARKERRALSHSLRICVYDEFCVHFGCYCCWRYVWFLVFCMFDVVISFGVEQHSVSCYLKWLRWRKRKYFLIRTHSMQFGVYAMRSS